MNRNNELREELIEDILVACSIVPGWLEFGRLIDDDGDEKANGMTYITFEDQIRGGEHTVTLHQLEAALWYLARKIVDEHKEEGFVYLRDRFAKPWLAGEWGEVDFDRGLAALALQEAVFGEQLYA